MRLWNSLGGHFAQAKSDTTKEEEVLIFMAGENLISIQNEPPKSKNKSFSFY